MGGRDLSWSAAQKSLKEKRVNFSFEFSVADFDFQYMSVRARVPLLNLIICDLYGSFSSVFSFGVYCFPIKMGRCHGRRS